MAKTDFQTHDEYLATMPDAVRATLEQVRSAIHAGVPEPTERISYQIPLVEYLGHPVLYYSGYAKHWSLSCPPPFAPFTEFAEQLAPYEVSKSAVKFPLDQPVPTELLTAMARHQSGLIEQKGPKRAKPSSGGR